MHVQRGWIVVGYLRCCALSSGVFAYWQLLFVAELSTHTLLKSPDWKYLSDGVSIKLPALPACCRHCTN